ncbi:hypothetical protein IscW_ISCW016047, partial [Ixodes scapularis]
IVQQIETILYLLLTLKVWIYQYYVLLVLFQFFTAHFLIQGSASCHILTLPSNCLPIPSTIIKVFCNSNNSGCTSMPKSSVILNK